MKRQDMKVLYGKSVSQGIAQAKIYFLENNDEEPVFETAEDLQYEKERISTALNTAREQLKELQQRTRETVGEKEAAIFEIHEELMEDPDFVDCYENVLAEQCCKAEWAIFSGAKALQSVFLSLDDDCIRERAADIKDVSGRLIRILQGKSDNTYPTEPYILAAEELLPSQTVSLDKKMVRAFLTHKGSANSHVAILSRMMEIPAIVGISEMPSAEWNGTEAIVNGDNGEIILNPNEDTRDKVALLLKEKEEQKEKLNQLKNTRVRRADGEICSICANIATPEDVSSALQKGAEGVGLFRTEFLYLQRSSLPTEDEQFAAYKSVLEKMSPHMTVIRTMDIGADKELPCLNMPKEDNPALGQRAIRILFEKEDIFEAQIRALLRASLYGKLSVMFPMITSVEEVRKIKTFIEKQKEYLKAQGIPFSGDIQWGVMIETPAAAVISDLLADEVDFFSIGSNDLTQYVLATDRMNDNIQQYYRSNHPAVLRLIKTTVDNAHAKGKWVGICGEAAADLSLIPLWMEYGVDELSMASPFILKVKQKILSLNY